MCTEPLCPPRVVVGVPGGTPLNAAVEAPGYVAECPLLPGDCDALRGSGMGNDAFLYDVTGGWDQVWVGGVRRWSDDVLTYVRMCVCL